MTNVLFVCLGNICRSPMAEFVFKNMVKKAGLENEIYTASRATSTWEIGNPVHTGTKSRLLRENISIEEKHAELLKKDDYEKFDYIIGMDKGNIKDIMKILGSDPKNKVYLLLDFAEGGEIADPWYTGDFEAAWQDVLAGCRGLLAELTGTKKE